MTYFFKMYLFLPHPFYPVPEIVNPNTYVVASVCGMTRNRNLQQNGKKNLVKGKKQIICTREKSPC